MAPQAFPATPAIARSLVSAALLDTQGLVEFLERAGIQATPESPVLVGIQESADSQDTQGFLVTQAIQEQVVAQVIAAFNELN